MCLYDFERDGEIPYGKTLIFYEDGTKQLISTKTLERSQDDEFTPRDIVRSRPVRSAKHRKENPRRTSLKRPVPIRKTKHYKQSLP